MKPGAHPPLSIGDARCGVGFIRSGMSQCSDEILDQKYRELCFVMGHLFIAFGRLETALASLLKMHLSVRMLGGWGISRHSDCLAPFMEAKVFGVP